MANFYLDVSAIGNEYQAYANAMTWGAGATDKPLPQDGNGVAGSGHSAAVAIAEILINAQPADTNTLVIAGATITAKTTVAAKNQFAIGASVAATVTNIVSLINTYGTASNQCDATMPTTVSALALPLVYWQYARVKPGTTNTVQIATRIAGADLNYHATLRTYMLISHAGWGTAPTFTQFAGGADGPFAYLVTNSTVFGKTAKTYGVMTASKVGSVTDPGAATDAIIVRTRRSGADITVSITDTTTRYDWTIAPASTNRQFVFDDGSFWSGDAGVLTLALTSPTGFSGGFSTMRCSDATNSFTSVSGRRYRIYVEIPSVATSVYGYQLRLLSSSYAIFIADGIVIEEDSGISSSSTGLFVDNSNNSSQKWHMSNSKWIARAGRALVDFGNNPGTRFQYTNCEFEYFGLSANVSNIVDIAGTGNDQAAEFIGCKFYDRNGVYSVVSPVASGGAGVSHKVVFDGCSGVDAVASGWTPTSADYNRVMAWENFGPYRDWRVEVGAWLAEWRYGQNHPTLNSVLQNGTPWSARVLLRNIMIWGVNQRPFKIPGTFRGTTAAKTITLEFLAQMAFPKSQLGILVAYIDSDDVIRYQHTLESRGVGLSGVGTNVAISGQTWTLNGKTGFTAYYLSLTTTYSMKANTDFVVYVIVNGTVASDQTLYFDGEVALT